MNIQFDHWLTISHTFQAKLLNDWCPGNSAGQMTENFGQKQ